MESTHLIVLYSLIGVIWFAELAHFLIFWARSRGLEDSLNELRETTPSKRLTEVESTSEALLARVDQMAVDNGTFRSQVHNELQRFDQIMRRKEAAVRKLAAAEPPEENGDESPDTIPASEGMAAVQNVENARGLTRAQLRDMWREKHGTL